MLLLTGIEGAFSIRALTERYSFGSMQDENRLEAVLGFFYSAACRHKGVWNLWATECRGPIPSRLASVTFKNRH